MAKNQHVLLKEDGLPTAGRSVWHLYRTNGRADLKELARLLFCDEGDSWDIIGQKDWDVECIASTEYDDTKVPDVEIDAVFCEHEFVIC